jgi:DNA-directed RNA polymerase subunit M/transcription elongation factor TFIIS
MGLLQNNYCPFCKIEGSQIKLVAPELDVKTSNTTIVSNKVDPKATENLDWIGPIERMCIRPDCKGKKAYFKIMSPHSLDEPPIVLHRCTTCNNIVKDYRN